MPGDSENMFYSFDVGPVHFVSISTEFYYFTNFGMKTVANQYKWLVKDLEVSKFAKSNTAIYCSINFSRKPPALRIAHFGPGSSSLATARCTAPPTTVTTAPRGTPTRGNSNGVEVPTFVAHHIILYGLEKFSVGLPVLHLYGLERLLYEHSVDLAFWAHEHNYERHWPVYDYRIVRGSRDTEQVYRDTRATVHVTTGSAVRKDTKAPDSDA